MSIRRILLVVLLACGMAPAAISFHASSTGPNPNGGNVTTTLPTVSNNDYVLCQVIAASWPATGGTTTLTPWVLPSGWTDLVNVGGTEIIGQVWTTGAATSVTFVGQNSTGGWETSGCVSYSGVDTTNPIDGKANWFVNGSSNSHTVMRAPSTSPAFTNDQLVAFYVQGSSGGAAVSTPAGLTNRVGAGPGPTVYIFDKALASGAATGNFDTTNVYNQIVGAQILLKAAAGGSAATTPVQPTMGGGITTTCASFGGLFPSSGDLVVVATHGAGTGTAIAGFTKAYQTADVGLFANTWTSGTSTSLTVTGNAGNSGCDVFLVRNYNPTGGTLVPPSLDASATSTAASATSLATASIAASGTSDLLFAMWSSGDNTTANSQLWTLSASLQSTSIYTDNAGTETIASGILQAPSNPSGAFTSTIAGSAARLGAGIATFVIKTNSKVMRLKDAWAD